jgi:hypothetical protein
MSEVKQARRVIIVVTETSPVAELWDAALHARSDTQDELVVVFFHDERWHRAASLPFTREVPMAGGAERDFTLQRAEQLLNEAAANLRKAIEKLASSAGLSVAFQTVSELDTEQAQLLLAGEISVVVGPSALAEHPVLAELRRLDRRLVLIESSRPRAAEQ